MPNIYLSPEDRASNTYAPSALWNGKPTNEKEQMGRCADLLETALTRCGFTVRNVQRGNMYDRVRESNDWPAALHIALHTNGFNGLNVCFAVAEHVTGDSFNDIAEMVNGAE